MHNLHKFDDAIILWIDLVHHIKIWH